MSAALSCEAPGEVAKLREELGPQKTPAPVKNDGFWQTADPASLGMTVAALRNHRLLCQRSGADAYLVIRRGKIVQEYYSAALPLTYDGDVQYQINHRHPGWDANR